MLIYFIWPLLFVFILCALNWYRSQKNEGIALSPNFLLTRYPIVFIEGKKSVFYFGRYWNYIPTLLQEHGYDCTFLNMPWKSERRRQQHIAHFFNGLLQRKQKVHIIGDSTSIKELTFLLEQNSSYIESLWIAKFQSDSLPVPQGINDLELSYSNESKFSIWTLLLWLHSKYIGQAQPTFSHEVLGVSGYCPQSQLDQAYLNWARTLAESDYNAGLRILPSENTLTKEFNPHI